MSDTMPKPERVRIGQDSLAVRGISLDGSTFDSIHYGPIDYQSMGEATREAVGKDMRNIVQFDRIVRTDDTRASGSGSPERCYYCPAKLGEDHTQACVVYQGRRLDAMPIGVWQPIETYCDGDFVLFWFPNGERGNGGMTAAMSFQDDDGVYSSGWTHGAANAGWEFDFCEPPTMWCRLPNQPLQIEAEEDTDQGD